MEITSIKCMCDDWQGRKRRWQSIKTEQPYCKLLCKSNDGVNGAKSWRVGDGRLEYCVIPLYVNVNCLLSVREFKILLR